MTMPLHIAPPGQYIIEPEANIENEAKANASRRGKWQAYRMAITLVNRENKAKWLNQEWRDSQQDTTFRQGFMHQGKIKIRQVANTPMYKLRCFTTCATGKVGFFNERYLIPTCDRIEGDASAGNAPADDQHIKIFAIQESKVVYARS